MDGHWTTNSGLLGRLCWPEMSVVSSHVSGRTDGCAAESLLQAPRPVAGRRQSGSHTCLAILETAPSRPRPRHRHRHRPRLRPRPRPRPRPHPVPVSVPVPVPVPVPIRTEYSGPRTEDYGPGTEDYGSGTEDRGSGAVRVTGLQRTA